MGIRKTVTCDECNSQKDVVNHWFAARMSGLSLEMGKFDVWSQTMQINDEVQLYCGQRCCSKAHQRWMDTGTLEKQDAKTQGW